MKTNRKGFPIQLQTAAKEGLPDSESQICQRGNLMVSLADNHPMVMIATNSDPTVMDSAKCKSKDGTRSYSCPTLVWQYKKCMGEVACNDHLRGYFWVFSRSKKYYKYLFWFLVDLVITNSYILCLHRSDLRKNGIKDFRCTLAKQLIGDYHSRKQPGRPSTRPQPKGSARNTFQVKEMTNHTAITTAIVTGMSVDVQYGGARIVTSSSATGKNDDFFHQHLLKLGKWQRRLTSPAIESFFQISSTWSPQITARIFQVSYLSCEPNRNPRHISKMLSPSVCRHLVLLIRHAPVLCAELREHTQTPHLCKALMTC